MNEPMIKIGISAIIAAAIFTMGMNMAQAQRSKTSFGFNFEPVQAAPGSVPVAPDTAYTPERGYGFEPGAVGTAGDAPRLFSVALPEGNYQVTITLGNSLGPSSNTVRAEARRLMLEKVNTVSGQLVTRTFTVNVRTPKIPAGGHVKLKGREIGPPLALDWDDKLTLEFNGARPRVQTVAITPAPHAIALFIVRNIQCQL